MREITIALACEKQFLPFTACTICSIMENNRDHALHFYVLYDSLKVGDLTRLDKYCHSYGQSLTLIEMEQNEFEGLRTTYQFPRAVYYRQLLPTLLPQDVEKVLYLDSDLIVRRDISEVWETNIEGFSLAAVPEPFSDYERLGLPRTSLYFNAGIMLMNLRWWRENDFQSRVIEHIRSSPESFFLFNQDSMNLLLIDQWVRLPETWNMMTIFFTKEKYRQQFAPEIENPAIVHFTGAGKEKPWHPLCQHPFAREYWRYQRMTPWNGPYPSYYSKLLMHYIENILRRFRKQN